MRWKFGLLALATVLAALFLNTSCSRQLAALTPPPPSPTPTFTATATATATLNPSSGVAFDTFDGGGAEGSYTNSQPPGWLASTFVQGTTTEGLTCVTTQAYSPTHSIQSTINFDSGGDLAEAGLYNWAGWGAAVNASAATGHYSFFVMATGPVTIANLYLCNSSCLPEIENAGINLLVPGDSQWHNFVVPLGTGSPAGWTFTNGVPPWTNSSVVQVFFDMVGPQGPVTVYYDDIYFYP